MDTFADRLQKALNGFYAYSELQQIVKETPDREKYAQWARHYTETDLILNLLYLQGSFVYSQIRDKAPSKSALKKAIDYIYIA